VAKPIYTPSPKLVITAVSFSESMDESDKPIRMAKFSLHPTILAEQFIPSAIDSPHFTRFTLADQLAKIDISVNRNYSTPSTNSDSLTTKPPV